MEIPIKDLASSDKNAVTTMRAPMVLPHELLCYLIVPLLALIININVYIRQLFYTNIRFQNCDFFGINTLNNYIYTYIYIHTYAPSSGI